MLVVVERDLFYLLPQLKPEISSPEGRVTWTSLCHPFRLKGLLFMQTVFQMQFSLTE